MKHFKFILLIFISIIAIIPGVFAQSSNKSDYVIISTKTIKIKKAKATLYLQPLPELNFFANDKQTVKVWVLSTTPKAQSMLLKNSITSGKEYFSCDETNLTTLQLQPAQDAIKAIGLNSSNISKYRNLDNSSLQKTMSLAKKSLGNQSQEYISAEQEYLRTGLVQLLEKAKLLDSYISKTTTTNSNLKSLSPTSSSTIDPTAAAYMNIYTFTVTTNPLTSTSTTKATGAVQVSATNEYQLTVSQNYNVTVSPAQFSVDYRLTQPSILLTQRDTLVYKVNISTEKVSQKVYVRLQSLTNGTKAYLLKDETLLELTTEKGLELTDKLESSIIFQSTKLGIVNYDIKFYNDKSSEQSIKGSYEAINSDYVIYANYVAPTYLTAEDKAKTKELNYAYNETLYKLNYYTTNNTNQSFKLKSILFGANGSVNDYIKITNSSGKEKTYKYSASQISITEIIALPSSLTWYSEKIGNQSLRLVFENQDGSLFTLDKNMEIVPSTPSIAYELYGLDENELAYKLNDFGNEIKLGRYLRVPFSITDPNPNARFDISISSSKLFNTIADFRYEDKQSFDYFSKYDIDNDGVHTITINITKPDGTKYGLSFGVQHNYQEFEVTNIRIDNSVDNLVKMKDGESANFYFTIKQGKNTKYDYALAFVQANTNSRAFEIQNFVLNNYSAFVANTIFTYKSISNAIKVNNDNYYVTLKAINTTTNQVMTTPFHFVIISRFDVSNGTQQAAQKSYPTQSSIPASSLIKPQTVEVSPTLAKYEDGYPYFLETTIYSSKTAQLQFKLKQPDVSKTYRYKIVSENETAIKSTDWVDISSPADIQTIQIPTFNLTNQDNTPVECYVNLQIAQKGEEAKYATSRRFVRIKNDYYELNLEAFQYYKGDTNQYLVINTSNGSSYNIVNPLCHNKLTSRLNVKGYTSAPDKDNVRIENIRISFSTDMKNWENSDFPVNTTTMPVSLIQSSVIDPLFVKGSTLYNRLQDFKTKYNSSNPNNGAYMKIIVNSVNQNGYEATDIVYVGNLRSPHMPIFSENTSLRVITSDYTISSSNFVKNINFPLGNNSSDIELDRKSMLEAFGIKTQIVHKCYNLKTWGNWAGHRRLIAGIDLLTIPDGKIEDKTTFAIWADKGDWSYDETNGMVSSIPTNYYANSTYEAYLSSGEGIELNYQSLYDKAKADASIGNGGGFSSKFSTNYWGSEARGVYINLNFGTISKYYAIDKLNSTVFTIDYKDAKIEPSSISIKKENVSDTYQIDTYLPTKLTYTVSNKTNINDAKPFYILNGDANFYLYSENFSSGDNWLFNSGDGDYGYFCFSARVNTTTGVFSNNTPLKTFDRGYEILNYWINKSSGAKYMTNNTNYYNFVTPNISADNVVWE